VVVKKRSDGGTFFGNNTALPSNTKLTHLLPTHCHCDHAGGAEALRRNTGCRVCGQELNAVYLEKGDEIVTAAARHGARLPPLKVDGKISGINSFRKQICGRHRPDPA
jgi:glyoxylase-like metal-dependent hydrolase (beta-lactamase superfamily II)